jgi:hypothetical protein
MKLHSPPKYRVKPCRHTDRDVTRGFASQYIEWCCDCGAIRYCTLLERPGRWTQPKHKRT